MAVINQPAGLSQGTEALAGDVLLLYLKAAEMRRLNVAEHLLQALEELAQADPCCQCMLDHAYTRIVPPGELSHRL